MAITRNIVVLSGEVGAGKTTLAQRLVERYAAYRISTHELLSQRLGGKVEEARGALQTAGEQLDRDTGGVWVRDGAGRIIERRPGTLIIIDAVRIKEQVDALRATYGKRVTHVHLGAPLHVLEKRYTSRKRTTKFREFATYSKVRANPTERAVADLANDADIVIDTAQCTAQDVEVRAAAHLGLSARDAGPLVDVIIGGQFGSEGKGNIAFYLAPAYDLLVRVGGPNAGHIVPLADNASYTHRLLPSGTRNSKAPILIAPGAVLDVDTLLKEAKESGVTFARLSIDPQAMVVSKADIAAEKRLVSAIGSTGKGVGAATARRIMRRGRRTRLAADVRELQPFVRPAHEVLQDAFSAGQRILVEGTQGTMLSLYHGYYPHVTSRDTSVSGCLAEAGIPPRQVRRVVMVCRTYPIRVRSPEGSTSGHMSQELSWQELSKRSGISVGELRRTEKGSVSGKQRRVAEFDWALLRRAAQLNGPTDIALTFADYLSVENRSARRLDQLTEETIRFIEEVERVAGADVSLISTRFHPRCIIDRRHW